MAVDTFPAFRKLPPEIRLRIWSFAAPSPRIVELTWNSKARSIVSRTRVPATLHACHDARAELIKSYKSLQFTDSQVILIDFETDTLFFGAGCKCMVPSGKSRPWIVQNTKVVKDISKSECLRENLKSVAFDCEFLLAMDEENLDLSAAGMIHCLKKLERVVLVKKDIGNRSERIVRDGVGMVLKKGVKNSLQLRCVRLLSVLEFMFAIDTCEFVVEKEDDET